LKVTVENFPSNSQTPRLVGEEKPEDKRILKVVDGEVTRRKKPLGTRMREMFLANNDQSVFEYVLLDVMVPAFKDLVSDTVSTTIERVLFGDSTNRSPRRKIGSGSGVFGNSGVNYNRYSSSNTRRDERPSMSRRSRENHDFDDMIIPTRAEAQDVVDGLVDLVRRYESASVADLYRLAGVEFHHTDEKWGWTELDGAGVRRLGPDRYLLVLPKTEPLD
jgi:hypothetical protein